MKKTISLLAVCVLMFSSLICGCGNENTAKSTKATETTQKSEDKLTDTNELKNYLSKSVEGDNPIYGTWKLEGIDVVSFIFRNDNLAQMVMGTEADFASLSLNTKKKTLSVTFVLGLNGDYSYELSEDEKILTLSSKGKDIRLIKQKDYNLIPKSPKNPKIDEKLIGWWESEDKITYFFGSDGIMYSNHISMETCYTYNADKGKIDAVYDYGGDVKESFDYSFNKDGNLIIDGTEYKQFINK
ncbi:MAG: hypothetical protein J1E41_01075 [Ruminococcus sp.]|nr:hypothetical protein [Ruminococcus sp.]